MNHLLNQVINADCFDIFPDIPDGSIDMIFCDLPYGTTQNAWDTPLPFELLWSQYERIIKSNGAIVLTAQPPFDKMLAMSNIKLLRYEWIWEKQKATGFLNARKMPLKAHENILVFYKQLPTYNPQMVPGEPYNKGRRKAGNGNGTYGNFEEAPIINETGDRFPRSVIRFKTADAEGEIFHPTQKPVELCEYFIRTYSNAGDVVLDNCAGAATTAVAAAQIGRNYIAIEKERKWAEIGRQRLQNVQLALTI